MIRIVPWFILICLSLPMAAAEETLPPWWSQAQAQAHADGYVLLTPVALDCQIRHGLDFLLVDVRPGYEYERGHIDGAANYEFNLADRLALTPEKRAAFEGLLGPDKTRNIVFYCRSFR